VKGTNRPLLSFSRDRRGRPASLVPSPHWVSLGALGALTLMTLALVILAVAFAHRSADPVVLLEAMGEVGLGVLDDASWLFPSLIATLLVVAIIPRGTQEWPQVSAEPAATTTSVVLAAAPAAVGVLATSSIALVIVGVAAHSTYAVDLLAPLSLFVVIEMSFRVHQLIEHVPALAGSVPATAPRLAGEGSVPTGGRP